MKLCIAAIGKLKSGPEKELVARYCDRITAAGKPIGCTQFQNIEIPESRASGSDQRKADEFSSLIGKLPDSGIVIAFDERGKTPDSRAFSSLVQRHIENGAQQISFIVGGPDGLSQEMRQHADHVVSFGSLTMPHQLVRILVAEQVYRAITLLTNHPYHRD